MSLVVKSDQNDILLSSPLKAEPFKNLNSIVKRPPIDIEFQDLQYSVRSSANKSGWRQLLKSVNGKFRSGEFTAILGPSGAGKSTLLNILAGYVSVGVQGSIKVNGRSRDMKIFNKLSSYIMQEDLIQPRLTVREAMMVATNLKLGSVIRKEEKIAVVDEVINLLGLEKCCDTMSEYLSGGQRKRLVLALELVNNPPVIFLDEPTSGLDNFAIRQCIDLLVKITKHGRTVICTIHQPPASIFHRFDQVYVIANGNCVYNGSPSQLVPFLSQANLPCPNTYTPADYIIELVHSNQDMINSLSSFCQNGKLNNKVNLEKTFSTEFDHNMLEVYQETTQSGGMRLQDITYAATFWIQFQVLLSRMILQMKRNTTMLYIQFFHHVISGLLVGGIFYGCGNDATQTIALFKYCLCVNVFFMYTHVMAPVLLFPMEVKLLRREYFNRWYGLKPYYLALSLSTFPLVVLPGIIFLAIVYFMSYQPLEGMRFFWFCMMGLSVGVASQGLGYSIGSMFNITNGSVVGPSTLAPLLALAVYGMGYRANIEPIMKMLMSLSYMRHGLVGFCSAIFTNRPPLHCPESELYCHYRNPDMLMADFLDVSLHA